ncbi:hypothetical protein SAE01_14580 [Segetibacter aerophilus]|uniref:Uncharacterized protein n=1 Tax=Segetibacter aerophilus TaxID=670293 RepID=A0A512BAH4_9BACT|nr:hypothetical protein SAE01_14580 [Segetibacter aerophilus]
MYKYSESFNKSDGEVAVVVGLVVVGVSGAISFLHEVIERAKRAVIAIRNVFIDYIKCWCK